MEGAAKNLILIVEEGLPEVHFAQFVLEHHGYETHLIGTVAGALATAIALRPKVIMVDPAGKGLEFLNTALSCPELAKTVIAVHSNLPPKLLPIPRDCPHIPKPISHELLLEKIKAFIQVNNEGAK